MNKRKKERDACKWGCLRQYVENPVVQFEYGDTKSVVFLRLNDKNRVQVFYCQMCGGYEMGPATKEAYKCVCHSLSKWADIMDSPIKYDVELQEYHLVGLDQSTFYFHFCPNCGGRLPKSKRDGLFTKPSVREVRLVRERVKDAQSMDEVVQILGSPDRVFDSLIEIGADITKKEYRKSKRAFLYESISEKMNVIVQEYPDGEIETFFLPKLKK
jgi:hypothetical protein